MSDYFDYDFHGDKVLSGGTIERMINIIGGSGSLLDRYIMKLLEDSRLPGSQNCPKLFTDVSDHLKDDVVSMVQHHLNLRAAAIGIPYNAGVVDGIIGAKFIRIIEQIYLSELDGQHIIVDHHGPKTIEFKIDSSLATLHSYINDCGSYGLIYPERYNRRDLTMVTENVIHDTATNSSEVTIKILRRRKLSTHFIIDVCRDVDKWATNRAKIIQCAPLSQTCQHIGYPHNNISIGIDVVTPYYPEWSKWNSKIITNGFAHRLPKKSGGKGKHGYVVPYNCQIYALNALLHTLANSGHLGFNDVSFKEKIGNEFNFGVLEGLSKIPGKYDGSITSHYSIGGHADGQFVTYQLARLNFRVESGAVGIDWSDVDVGDAKVKRVKV